MKTLNEWFDEYAISHQNETNKAIHYICVPAIYFSIIGLFLCIPFHFISNGKYPMILNWATIPLVFVLLFYLRHSFKIFIKMLLFSILCLILNYYISTITQLFYVSIGIFVLAWIGQFYGHKIEGKKPSFIKDLKFLLIGPAWVFEKLSKL